MKPDAKTEDKTMNMHEFEARRIKAHAIATLCRKQKWTAEDLADFGPARLTALAKICGITLPSAETVAMALGMLIAQPPFTMTAEEMREQDAAFDAHILGIR